MSPFFPNLTDYTAPLRNLLKENVDFAWNSSHSKAFEKVKSLVCTTTTLEYYERKEPLSCPLPWLKGLGSALFPNNKEIAFASKALTPAETRCANIERQLLIVVYGCEKFHSCLYGRSFVVKTNHGHIHEHIHKKNLMQAPPRLQILWLRLEQALRLRQLISSSQKKW